MNQYIKMLTFSLDKKTEALFDKQCYNCHDGVLNRESKVCFFSAEMLQRNKRLSIIRG